MPRKNIDPKPAPVAVIEAPAPATPPAIVTYSTLPDVPPVFCSWAGPALHRLYLDNGGWFMFDENGRFTPSNQQQADLLLVMHKRYQAGWAGYPDIHPI